MQNSETGRDSTQKKEEQITSHPSHASSELISYNMLSNWLMKVDLTLSVREFKHFSELI